jgi:hypothetical protein
MAKRCPASALNQWLCSTVTLAMPDVRRYARQRHRIGHHIHRRDLQSGRSLASARAMAPVPVPRSRIRHGAPADAPAPAPPDIRYPGAGSASPGRRTAAATRTRAAHQMGHRLAALAALSSASSSPPVQRSASFRRRPEARSAPGRSRAQQDLGVASRAFAFAQAGDRLRSHC